MIEEVFVDGVSAIGMSKGAVRMDLYTVEPGNFDVRVPRQRLIMTGEGFRELYQIMTQAMQRLDAAACSMPQPGGPETKLAGDEDAAAEAAKPQSISPNF